MRALKALTAAGVAAGMLTAVAPATAAANPLGDAAGSDFSTHEVFPAFYPGHDPEWARALDVDFVGDARPAVVTVYLSRQQTAEFAAGRGLPLGLFTGSSDLRLFPDHPVQAMREGASEPNACMGITYWLSRTAPLGYTAFASDLPQGECPGD